MSGLKPRVGWVLAILGVSTAGCLTWLGVRQSLPEDRVYRIGWEVDPPEQVRGDDGEPTGFAVELVSEAARRRGIRLEWVYRQESSEAALRSGHVDLWPVMTITPERTRILHISLPYLQSTHCLLVRGNSAVRQLADLSEKRIGYTGVPVNRVFLARYIPRAQPVVRPQGDLIKALCAGEIDGAFLEQHSAISALLGGSGCPGQALRIVSIDGPRLQLGVGSTFASAAAADAIRGEIGAMVDEGLLPPLLAKWGFLTGRSEHSIATLLSARRRERWSLAVAGLFACLLVLAVWEARRATRESRKAKLSELSLRESERRFRELFENISLFATIEDRKGNIAFANRFALEVTGWTAEEVLGRSRLDFFPPEYHERIVQALALGGETVAFVEAPFRTKAGNHRWVQWHSTPLRDAAGGITGLASLGVDVTEHRAVQEQYLQVQKMDSIGRLAGGVAHDFNNLLTVINGYSELLLARPGETDRWRGDIEQIRSAGERAAGLTRQLLAFSRKQVTRPETFDLNELLLESQRMLRRVLPEQIEMITTPAPAPANIMADRDQIHQVLMNLVVNARDAMPGGGRLRMEVNVVVHAGGHDGLAGKYVVLTVADTGVGMDEPTKARIFEPFFTTKPKGGGTGLGLATVYGIAKQASGWIDVESEIGEGATFRVYLPETAAPVTAEPETGAVANPTRGAGTVLIAEDQQDVRGFVRSVLESRGYRVLSAASASEALAISREYRDPIDVLLSDVVMPGMNGRELAEALVAARPGIRVILTSGYAGELAEPLPSSSFGYLAKPFSAEQLASKIAQVTRQRAAG